MFVLPNDFHCEQISICVWLELMIMQEDERRHLLLPEDYVLRHLEDQYAIARELIWCVLPLAAHNRLKPEIICSQLYSDI